METAGLEPVNTIRREPRFRDTLRGLNEERIDDLVFARMQPKASDVICWVIDYLGQTPGFENLQLQLLYVTDGQDRVMSGNIDAVRKIIEIIDGPYAKLNWVSNVLDSGGSAIFKRESGREPCELQVITAAQNPTVDPAGLLNYVVQQYEYSIPANT
jgi:hypothetical protein